MFTDLIVLPRLHSEHGFHRAPTVGLAVVGALLVESSHTVDLFPMSLVREKSWNGEVPKQPLWQAEAFRLQYFMQSGRPGCSIS